MSMNAGDIDVLYALDMTLAIYYLHIYKQIDQAENYICLPASVYYTF